jgi:O-antigen/teichoic acid export membrane protein
MLTAMVPHLVASSASPLALDAVTRRKMLATYVLVVCLASVTMAVGAPYVVRFLFPASYEAAGTYIAWISLARCFHGMSRVVLELSFFQTEHFRRIALLSLVVSLAYTAMTLALLEAFGGIGAGMGLAAGHGLWMAALLLGRRWLVR